MSNCDEVPVRELQSQKKWELQSQKKQEGLQAGPPQLPVATPHSPQPEA